LGGFDERGIATGCPSRRRLLGEGCGPELDTIVAAYRDMTGPAPLFGKWAYGYWQCKNRYRSQEEILSVAHKYRDLHIPIDNIVQDWFWWTAKGSFLFNKNYPDPKAMMGDLHRNHFHLMISVWPFFDPGSAVYDEMDPADMVKMAKMMPNAVSAIRR